MSAVTPVRIYENFRVVSYAPMYLASARGLFDRHGVAVDIRTSPTTSETAEGLLAGRVDVSWGGPMRVMLHHASDPGCPLQCFCKVVGPEPFCLVGHAPNPTFRFADLRSRRVAVVTEVPTPWLLLQEDLRRAGIDPEAIDVAPPATMAENVARLAAGDVDVIQVMEPYTELALAGDESRLWHAFASRGDVAFTSFYTRRDYAEQHPEVLDRIDAALGVAMASMRSEPASALAHELASFFPDLATAVLTGAIGRYQRLGIWPATTALGPVEFVRLKLALLSGGFIGRDVPYASAVIAGSADAA